MLVREERMGGGGLKVARSSAVILRTDSGAAREGICVTLSCCSLIKNGVIMLIGFPGHSSGSSDIISLKKHTHTHCFITRASLSNVQSEKYVL